MKTQTTYRPALALSLALLVLQAVVFKELHHLLDHHHNNGPHCEATGNQQHLHGEEYHHTNCDLCLFHLAPAKLDPITFFVNRPGIAARNSSFFYKNPAAQSQRTTVQLRGPPAFVA